MMGDEGFPMTMQLEPPALVFPGLYTLASPQGQVQLKQSCLQQVAGSGWILR